MLWQKCIVLLQYYLSQISPTSSNKLELDGITIVNSGKNNCHHVAKTTISNDLDLDEHDLFVHVDNPEKHVTAMETYITFRVITKVSHFNIEQCSEALLTASANSAVIGSVSESFCLCVCKQLSLDICEIKPGCCSTDTGRPHCCCHLPNDFGSCWIFRILYNEVEDVPPKLPHSLTDSSIFRAHAYDQHTHRHTNDAISVTIGRICVM